MSYTAKLTFTSKLTDPPPPVEELQPIFTGYRIDIYQESVPPDSLVLPEGYEAIKTKHGVIAPKDRFGNLRKLNEEWWELTWIDGQYVPIKCRWRGRAGPRYYIPDAWHTRKMCSAFDGTRREWCTLPREECVRHCQCWSMFSGRSCSSPRFDGGEHCYRHSRGARKGPEAKVKAESKKLYTSASKWFREGMVKIRKAMAGDVTDLTPEIAVLKTFLDRMLSEMSDNAEVMERLKAAKYAKNNAKSELDRQRAEAAIDHLIDTGADTAVIIKEIRATAVEIGRLSAIKEKIEVERKATVTPDQLQACFAMICTVVASLLSHDRERLAIFAKEMRRIMQLHKSVSLMPLLEEKANQSQD